MIHIAICDDQKVHCKITHEIIKKYETDRNMQFSIDVYHTGKKMLDSEKEYDFIFMDIELENENGMDVADIYRKKAATKIVILTSHGEEIANGYKIRAFRFLTKPLREKELFEALDCGLEEITADKKMIVLDDNMEKAIRVSSVIYFEAGDRTTGVRTKEGFFMVRRQITDIWKEIDKMEFYMTHRTYIVNLNYVEAIVNNEILLINGERIKISRLKLTDFKETYYGFIRGKIKHGD